MRVLGWKVALRGWRTTSETTTHTQRSLNLLSRVDDYRERSTSDLFSSLSRGKKQKMCVMTMKSNICRYLQWIEKSISILVLTP